MFYILYIIYISSSCVNMINVEEKYDFKTFSNISSASYYKDSLLKISDSYIVKLDSCCGNKSSLRIHYCDICNRTFRKQ